MKKLGIILMACALIFGTTQCKKNDETNKPENNGESIFITLNVGCGTRANIVPEDDFAPVYYAEGDMIHVVSDGKYIGTLTYNGSNFTGDITNPTEGQPLHFYFLGNVTPNETLVVGETSTCSVVISDQTTCHPVISYAPSKQNYSEGTTNYTATLLNKCALVKFNVTTVSENATCITGMNNKVTVDFETNEFEYSQEGDGIITLSAGDGEKWVILLPQEEVSQTEAHSADGIYTGTCASVPAIVENDYQVDGVTVAISHPTGAINGLFTINANGDQVYFSQGNLQYIGSADIPYWKFADFQWEVFGSTTGQNSTSQYVNRDLFGWGTSGWDSGNTYYRPWDTDNSNTFLYGPPENHNLTGDYNNSDWGQYNAIVNGGNQPGQWRTLNHEEWAYIFNTRNTPTGIRYAKAQITGTNNGTINGIILIPDNWSSNTCILHNTNQSIADFSGNVISFAQWNTMENVGAVFLPITSMRSGTLLEDVTWGFYWSASYCSMYGHAYNVTFSDVFLYTGYYYTIGYLGFAVRLVQNY